MSNRTCKIDGCERKVNARGLCHACYESLRSKGLLEPKKCKGCGAPCPGRKYYCNDDCKKRCSIDGCVEKVSARTWCVYHYTRWQLTGDPTTPRSREFYEDGQLCDFDECEEPVRRNRFCKSHSSQQFRGVDLFEVQKKNKQIGIKTCCLGGCESPLYANYLCATHNKRLRETGITRLLERKSWCRFPKCGGKLGAFGWCLKHYKRFFKNRSAFSRPCVQCGELIDLSEEDHNGRLKPRNRRVCGDCTRPSNLRTFVEFLEKRDGLNCGICGEIIDLKLQWPEPKSRSVDHIVPYSRGGKNHVDNYQLAHLKCNMDKRDRIGWKIAA